MDTLEGSRASAALIGLFGTAAWQARLAELRQVAGGSERVAKAVAQRHAVAQQQ